MLVKHTTYIVNGITVTVKYNGKCIFYNFRFSKKFDYALSAKKILNTII